MNEVYRLMTSTMKKEYKFSRLTLDDEQWIQENIKDYGEKINEDGVDLVVIGRVLYRLLINKDLIESYEIEETDENGETKVVEVKGLRAFMRSFSGQDDKIAMMGVFMSICSGSRPLPEKETVKKKIIRTIKSIFGR
jgi:UDP-2,3-diacylglucosamine pyrophosphatase LpxH